MPLESLISFLKKILPRPLINKVLPLYHYAWSLGSALYYRLPGRNLIVILVTGSKGKTTTAEIINTIAETAGYRTGLASTLRFKVFNTEVRNTYKMSVPGRGLIQKFLRQCVDAGCEVAVMEMTSQAVLDHRHRFLFPNVLVFTNLEPEHIEAHGGYDNYLAAKLQIARTIQTSPKEHKAIVANLDDKEARKFIAKSYSHRTIDYSFSVSNEVSRIYQKNELRFSYKKNRFSSPLQGLHNLANLVAGIKVGEFLQIPLDKISDSLAQFSGVRGRLEKITESSKLGFDTYVDYAHTPESLRAVYETFKDKTIIGVLGNTGGGRDTWKRPAMAKIAEEYCDHIILTDEDPYDEDPREIVDQMYQSIDNKDKVEIEIDRRTAISKALKQAKKNNVVLITGKGTDPFIMRANGEKEPWDDATVVREELAKLTSV